ncbi:MAG: TonB-dependent receptor [Proteobacteria bacterium]|nr:TonB-dependent receptor [Pseudomonadota bacterium]
MRVDRNRLLTTTIIAGVAAAVGLPTAAMAQDTPPPQQPPAAATPDKPASEVQEVVITGSRIHRNEFNSPDPIQVIRSEDAKLRGVADTTQLLQSSTIASGSPQVNAVISTAFVTNGGPGAQTISLRGLGANRTVFLLNGRRAGAAGTRGGVSSFDLNVLPESVIDRVEILKDGASSVYGSDAVAGVVNIITKTKMDGAQFDAFASQPFQTGGEQYRASAAWGKTWGRGGYFTVNVDYFKQNEQTNGQRDYTNCPRQYVFNPTTHARSDVVDPRTGQIQCRNLIYDDIWIYDGNDFSGRSGKLQFDYSGQLAGLAPKNLPGYPTSPAGFFIVGDTSTPNGLGLEDTNSPFDKTTTLSPALSTTSVFVQGGYDLGDHIQAYSEVLLSRRTSASHGYRQFWTYLYTEDGANFGWNNDPFSAGFKGNYFLSPTPVTNKNDANQKVNFARAVLGLKGDAPGIGFLKGWTWDTFVQYSRSEGYYGQDVILDDAVKASDGRGDFGSFGLFNANSIPRPTASCVGYTTPISHRPCVDVSWVSPDFLAGKYTAAEAAFLFDYEIGKTTYQQTTWEGSATGDLFNLPAGPVGAAVGFHVQQDSINDVPGKDTLASNVWGQTAAGITKGSENTKEAFGELSIPLIRDMPFIYRLDTNLSGRETTVDGHGSNFTYKVGVNWAITPEYRLRGTYGTSFRAPALFESFLANQTSFLGQRSIDPCINWGAALAANQIPQRVANNCAAQGVPAVYSGAGSSATIFTGGGPNLRSETSKAYTFGAIWTPKAIDLNVAVDYFNIQVNNEITTLGPNNIVFACLNSVSFPSDPLCSLFSRNASHLITVVHDNYVNIATQEDRGVDLTVRYRHDLPWDSRLTIDTQATWTFENSTLLFPSSAKVENNGTIGSPDFTALANLRVDHGPWTAFWSVDWIGRASALSFAGSDTNSAGTQLYKIRTEPTAYHSLSLRRDFKTWSLLVGVRNIFDERPPSLTTINVGGQYNTIGTSVLASQYDYIGRRAFMNITKRF